MAELIHFVLTNVSTGSEFFSKECFPLIFTWGAAGRTFSAG